MGPFIALTLTLPYIKSIIQTKIKGANPVNSVNLVNLVNPLIMVVATVMFFWPAMWVQPLNLPVTIISDALRASGNPHQKGSFFMGHPVPDPGLLFYPLVALLRTTPTVIICLVLGLLIKIKPHRFLKPVRFWEIPKISYPTFILILYIILYTMLVTYGGKKQDRYLLPIFPALDFLAASGALTTINFIKSRWATSSLLLLTPYSLLLTSYPYYFSYYNPLFGGATTAAQTMQVGWGEGLNEAATYLNNLPNSKSLKVVSWYSTTFEPYFHGQTIYKIDEAKISRSPKPGLAADYVIFYINQVQRRLPSEGGLAYFRQSPPVYTVTLNGLDYAWIYHAPAVSHIITTEKTRLVGQAELLGFDWLTPTGQRLTDLSAGNTAILRLYWEWQGKTAHEIFKLELVDQQGQPHSRGQLLTSNEDQVTKQDGAIMTSDFAFALSPDIPVGQYYLKAWLDRPSKKESVGQFPLLPTEATVSVK